jgi:uncharacterized protein (DUF4213/DUF364 family)
LALVPVLEEAKERFIVLVDKHDLRSEEVRVIIGALSAQQAIGNPSRQDFALLAGKEIMIEASFRGSFGQAFTSQPQNFVGVLGDVLNLNLESINNRAVFVSTLNAVMSYLGLATGVRHCRDDEPEKCASEMARELLNRFGKVRIGLIGLQPAILEKLIQSFGAHCVQCSDLDSKTVGSNKLGVKIRDGKAYNPELIDWSDIVLVTSSAIINNTFDDIRERCAQQGKQLIMFGVTGAAVSILLGLKRICPFGH